MNPAASLVRVAILAASLLLLWRVIHVNAGLYDDSGQPRLSRPAGTGASIGEPADAAAALRRMIGENPAEVRAILAIAQEREAAGDSAGASKAYRIALDLAPIGRQALALAAEHFLRHGDPAGLEYLERLVAHYPDAWSRAFPVLAALLARDLHRTEFSRLVSRNPAWLGAFIADACARGTDPSRLAMLVMESSANAPAAPAATGCVIDRLRGAGRWEEAYHLWLNVLPKERRASVGLVFNGGFEAEPAPPGFDWRLQGAPENQAGHTAEIVRAPGAQGLRVLRVAYNGRRQGGVPVRQYLLLAPGNYELAGMARPAGIKAARGIRWTVRCVEGERPGSIVAASERFLGSSDWRRFAVEVPIDGSCPGYALQLEPDVEEGTVAFVEGTAWFDDLSLRRRP